MGIPLRWSRGQSYKNKFVNYSLKLCCWWGSFIDTISIHLNYSNVPSKNLVTYQDKIYFIGLAFEQVTIENNYEKCRKKLNGCHPYILQLLLLL